MLILVTYTTPSKFLDAMPAIRACNSHGIFPISHSLPEYKARDVYFQIQVQVLKKWTVKDILGNTYHSSSQPLQEHLLPFKYVCGHENLLTWSTQSFFLSN